MPKISSLPPAPSLAGTDEAAFNQSGVTRRGNLSQFAAGMQADIDHTQIQQIGINSHAAIDLHIADLANPHVVTKTQVGLGNVPNLKVNLTAVAPPTVNDDDDNEYSVGSLWIDTVGLNEYVALDVTTGAAFWVATTSVALGIDSSAPAGNTSSARSPYPTVAAGSVSQTLFPMCIPQDFTSIVSVRVFGIAGATGSGLDIDLTLNNSDPATEVYNANSASDTTSTYNTTIDRWLTLDVTPLFVAVSANDQVGINVIHNTLGLTVYYHRLQMIYSRF
jgi:hypothetical protein